MPPEDSQEESVRICPQCSSIDVSLDSSDSIFGGGVPTYCCNNCDYTSKVFPEAKISDLEKLKKKK